MKLLQILESHMILQKCFINIIDVENSCAAYSFQDSSKIVI